MVAKIINFLLIENVFYGDLKIVFHPSVFHENAIFKIGLFESLLVDWFYCALKNASKDFNPANCTFKTISVGLVYDELLDEVLILFEFDHFIYAIGRIGQQNDFEVNTLKLPQKAAARLFSQLKPNHDLFLKIRNLTIKKKWS